MNIGHALKELRFKKFPNKKAFEIADQVGIQHSYLSQIENGRAEPSMKLIKDLCKIYKVPVPILFWMAVESQDIPKGKKKEAFEIVKGPMANLINEFL